MGLTVAAALTVLAAVSAAMEGQEPATLEIEVARSYRAAAGQTLFDAFIRVPFAMLEAAPQAGGDAAYRMAVTVEDSAGLKLLSQSWSQSVPEHAVTIAGASGGEHFAFAAKPGRYRIEVTVTDSATGRISRVRSEAAAFATPPGASDLLLAAGVRPATADDTLPRSGEIRKGTVFLEGAGRPTLVPQRAQLGYNLELYTEHAETVTVMAEVQSEAGARIIGTPSEQIALAAGGGATRGLLDLSGLPAGSYRLNVSVRTADSMLSRSAEFRMAGFETAAAVAGVQGSDDRFDRLSEPQLDTLYMPLIYLMKPDEQGLYPSLTAQGKRRYLRQFWAKRDPTPGTPRNEVLEDFYSRIAEANRRFREGGAAEIPGWRTDRGRIFIRYGAADEVLSRPQAATTAPYEVWKYTQERLRKYLFLDQTRFGNYALIWTDDRREPSRPNWQELLGPDAVEEILRF